PFDGSQLPAEESVAAAAAAMASHHLTPRKQFTEEASPFSTMTCIDAEAQLPRGAASESAFGRCAPNALVHVWDEVDALFRDPRAPRWAAMGCIAVLTSGTALVAAVYFLFLQEECSDGTQRPLEAACPLCTLGRRPGQRGRPARPTEGGLQFPLHGPVTPERCLSFCSSKLTRALASGLSSCSGACCK
ncbi:unnamed protein product, partial [Prorocentrum cordatum]